MKEEELNPVITGFHPDPSICRVGDDYFLANSSFEFFPGVPIYHSTDLINWKLIGHALNRRSQLDLRGTQPGGGVWAPTLRYNKGRWYMATSIVHVRTNRPRQPEGFYVYTDNIFDETSWSEPVFFDQVGIDQDLFFDDDGKVYLGCARYNRGPRQQLGTKQVTYASEIDITTGKSLTPPHLIRFAPEIGSVSEGGHIIKHAGWYYLFTAEGGTGPGHHVFVTRSSSPLGPYELPPPGVNPVVCNGNDPLVRRTGHADFVQDKNGKWWCVMLAVRPQTGETFQLGRETFLAPVDWPEGGWPCVNGGLPISGRVPASLPARIKRREWRDEFDSGWYHLRTPVRPSHSLKTRPGSLTLYGNAHTIQEYECPAMLLRKQTAYSGTWSTVIDFEPAHEYEEAGTAAFYSGDSYAALIVRKGAHGKVMELRWTDPVLRGIRRPIEHAGPLVLSIDARPDSYTFGYRPASTPETANITLGTLPAKVLDGGSDQEFEFYFTGAHFGLFAQGTDGEPATTPAHFNWAQFIEG